MNEIIFVVVLAVYTMALAVAMMAAWRLVRRRVNTPLAAGAMMGGLAALCGIAAVLLSGANEQSILIAVLLIAVFALFGVASLISERQEKKMVQDLKDATGRLESIFKRIKELQIHEVLVEITQPLVLMSQLGKLSAALKGKLKGIFVPAPFIESERSETNESCRHRVVLSDAEDFEVFVAAVMELPGVIGVTKGIGWDISDEERAQRLEELTEAKVTQKKERHKQLLLYRRLIEDKTRSDMVKYGLCEEEFDNLDYNGLRFWLQSVGPCEVEGRLVVLDPMVGFLSFDHFTQEAESGAQAIHLVADALNDRLRGPLPGVGRDFAEIPFSQERREKDGKHFLRLHVCKGNPHLLEARYEFFIRER